MWSRTICSMLMQVVQGLHGLHGHVEPWWTHVCIQGSSSLSAPASVPITEIYLVSLVDTIHQCVPGDLCVQGQPNRFLCCGIVQEATGCCHPPWQTPPFALGRMRITNSKFPDQWDRDITFRGSLVVSWQESGGQAGMRVYTLQQSLA